MAIKEWMSWEGGIDVAGFTASGLAMPNVLVHVARVVHTPFGSAPAGMIVWQPDPKAAPVLAGFVCTDATVGGYFGPRIFKDTPFEKAPLYAARIAICVDLPNAVASRVDVAGHVFEVTLTELGPCELIHRAAGSPMPFAQQGVEGRAGKAEIKVDGKPIAVTLPPVGLGGGPSAVWAPTGVYAR